MKSQIVNSATALTHSLTEILLHTPCKIGHICKLGVWVLWGLPSRVQGWIAGGGLMAKNQKPSQWLFVKIMY